MDKRTYIIDKSIYINLTNQCSNDCVFCVRNGEYLNNGDGMWLQKEPTSDEIIKDLEKYDFSRYEEVVFCGYGEPTYKINEIEKIGKYLKDRKIKIRINTNGQGNLIHKKDITPIICKYIDIISISLNEVTREKYQKICRSIYGEKAYDSIIEFAKLCVNQKKEVILSVVNIIDKKDIQQAKRIANTLGAKLRIREYIK